MSRDRVGRGPGQAGTTHRVAAELPPCRASPGSPPAELLRLERALAERDGTAVEGGLAGLLEIGFVEFGASGRRWDRESIIAHLATSPRRSVEITGFEVHAVAPDLAVATYEAIEGSGTTDERHSGRTSVWLRRDGRWRMAFHQGTLR